MHLTTAATGTQRSGEGGERVGIEAWEVGLGHACIAVGLRCFRPGPSVPSVMPSLLAVDLGLRTGLAFFGEDGRLQWYRSRNFGSRARLKNAASYLIRSHPDTTHLLVEGGGDLAPAWMTAAQRADIKIRFVDAATWRQSLLLPRDQRTGTDAKQAAGRLARKIIDWSGAARPTSLRHDAAEAILVGAWGVLELGWLGAVPPEWRAR